MSAFQTTLSRFSEKKYAGVVFVLSAFLALRLISMFTFYNGFLINFQKIAAFLPEDNFFGKIITIVPYHSWSICIGALMNPLFLAGVLVTLSPIITKKRFSDFNQLHFTSEERGLLFLVSFILSWELCTYDHNYYLESAFYFDRILLFVLPFVIWRLPVFVPLYVAFAFVYRSQFNYPVDGFDLFDKRLLFDILMMFTALSYVRIYFRNINLPFLYLVLCIIASGYFVSGLSKLTMSPHGYEWLWYNELSDFFLNARTRGWLPAMSKESIHSIWIFLNKYGLYLQLFVLLLELSSLFLLKNFRLCIWLLIGMSLMHFGIFLVGSMLFWKWMAVDLIMALLLVRARYALERKIFSQHLFRTSIIIIISSVIWLRPYPIGWFDTKVNQYFTYEAEDLSGAVTQIHKNDLDPFHQWFQYDKFLFLVDKPCWPVSGFGYTAKYKIQKQLNELPSDSIANCSSGFCVNQFDPKKKKKFDDFIKVYFTNRNKLNGRGVSFSVLKPPHHLNNSGLGSGLSKREIVKKFRVIYHVTYITESETQELVRETVDEIII